jgi:hypothetical protein
MRQRRVVGQYRPFDQSVNIVGANVISAVLREDSAQLTITFTPEEDDWGNERASTTINISTLP